MKDRIRSFIAVELCDEIRPSLTREVDRPRQTEADVRWVKPEAIHITLKFLGEVSRKKLPDVLDTMRDVAAGASPFRIVLSGVSFFPRQSKPRIIAAGIERECAEPLIELAGAMDERVSHLGFGREERSFKPHITIGRVKSRRGVAELGEALIDAAEKPLGEMVVSEVVMFMSELSRSGPTYTALGRAPLSKEPEDAD